MEGDGVSIIGTGGRGPTILAMSTSASLFILFAFSTSSCIMQQRPNASGLDCIQRTPAVLWFVTGHDRFSGKERKEADVGAFAAEKGRGEGEAKNFSVPGLLLTAAKQL